MDLDIRFCKASDGVNIAYAAIGEGYPLVYVHGWASHLDGVDEEVARPLSRHQFGDVGDVVLKGFEDPVRPYEVRGE